MKFHMPGSHAAEVHDRCYPTRNFSHHFGAREPCLGQRLRRTLRSAQSPVKAQKGIGLPSCALSYPCRHRRSGSSRSSTEGWVNLPSALHPAIQEAAQGDQFGMGPAEQWTKHLLLRRRVVALQLLLGILGQPEHVSSPVSWIRGRLYKLELC